MKKKLNLSELDNLELNIKKPCIIFLNWDLGTWKTTLVKYILNNILNIKESIKSPTYTYYNKYDNIYHFDLYRIKNYDEFFAIWWEEILDNNEWIILIEWPDTIKKYIKPNIIIDIKNIDDIDKREYRIDYIAK
jgi:tRNA threonylcarbamoyladenosine biosynthesis protein TsaE